MADHRPVDSVPMGKILQSDGSTDRGALLVEFALVIPFLVALVLGGVTTGLAYNVDNSLNNGARESARFGATLPTDAGLPAWLNEVADVAIRGTSGDMHATVPGQRVCVAYVHPDGTTPDDSTISLIEEAGSRLIVVGGTCLDDGRPSDEPRVQVSLERSSEIDAVLFDHTLSHSATTVVRFERRS